jgi:hypothetical protein
VGFLLVSRTRDKCPDNVQPRAARLLSGRSAVFLGDCLQVLNMLGSFSLLVLTTKPNDLIESLVRRGLSARIGYVLSSVLQIIPQMAASMETIMDAQRSRGMEMEGKLLIRLKAFIPLIGPVVMSSLIGVKERAMALEVMGNSLISTLRAGSSPAMTWSIMASMPPALPVSAVASG